jgi:hypothetical protein
MRPNEKTQREIDDYRQAVQDVAENVVAELQDADLDDDRDELLAQLVHDRTDQHEYVINDQMQIQTLLYSNHPCAAFFSGTYKSDYNSTDNFPFADFAADAFEMDVIDKVRELLEESDA